MVRQPGDVKPLDLHATLIRTATPDNATPNTRERRQAVAAMQSLSESIRTMGYLHSHWIMRATEVVVGKSPSISYADWIASTNISATLINCRREQEVYLQRAQEALSALSEALDL